MKKIAVTLVVALLLVGCITPAPTFRAGTPCEAASFTVFDNFAGARRGRCKVLAANHVELSIRPEDTGYINPSPWYAFRLVPASAGIAVISLKYVGGRHRYVPKISADGLNWSALDTSAISLSKDKSVATIKLPLGAEPVYLSAQELVTPPIYDFWAMKMAEQTDAELHLLGYSAGNQPIQYLVSNASATDVLLLVGRQHPPEVSGSFAMLSFVETLLADTPLARRFRDTFQIVAIPLMNPDGVLGGNWRHNLGSTDLNRDWGTFKQPETRLVGDLLDRLDANGDRIRVFLDFHSTDRNLFYTQDDSEPTSPPNFFKRWFAKATSRLADYSFSHEARPGKRPGVAKNYIYRRYGIPAATYEVGDETDRQAARASAVVLAEELMALMLETLAPTR